MTARPVPSGRGGLRGISLAGAVMLGLVTLVSWPQARELTTAFASHVDAYFSTWRLMWIARALRVDPAHLFDTNVFHPATGTLAFSDATLLQGLIAAPFLMAGASPILVYNLLLLAGFAGSGLAMFVLVRHLTGRTGAAIVSATVFAAAPYRIEHFMHLELQWTMFMPLTFWAIHRAIEERSWRQGVWSGIFLWLQFLSCVYYGVFLSMTAVVLALLLVLRSPRQGITAVPALAMGGLVGVLLTLPYAVPYLTNAQTLGGRDVEEVLRYSAQPVNYLAAAPENWLWGWTADRWGAPERRALPGLVAVLLSLWSLTRSCRSNASIYIGVALFAFAMSLGLNGSLYGWLFRHVDALHGLRAPARFAILVQCSVAVLAGLGLCGLQDRVGARSRLAASVAPLLAMMLLVAEYSNRPLGLQSIRPPDPSAPDVYRMIRSLGPGVIVELPMPTLSSLPGREATYAFWSASHWNKLVNGYSGYIPPVYAETLNVMEGFPDPESIARLRRLDVRYIVVHHAFLEDGRREQLLTAMASHADLEPLGAYRDPIGPVTLFGLRAQ